MTEVFHSEKELNREVMKNVIEAIEKGDVQKLNSYMADDMVHANPFTGTHRGIDEINKARNRVFGELGINKVLLKDIFTAGPGDVITLLEVHGTDVDGNTWMMPAANLFKLAHGKITELVPFYYDTGRLREVIAGRQAAASE